MAELSTIARPYAEALFDAAGTNVAAAAQWQDAIGAVAALLDDPSVASLLANPQLSDVRRFELLSGLYKKPLPGPIGELLKLIIENGRLAALPQVASQFHQQLNASQGVADCIIESAFALSAGELASLLTALSHKFPFELKPEVRINPQLIGGVRVTVGDRVLDSSVRARLEAMQARLTT